MIHLNKEQSDALDVLGLSYPFSLKVLKKRFRKLAVEYHPDKPENRTENKKDKFKDISAAYSTLEEIASESDLTEEDEIDRLIRQAQRSNPEDRGKIFDPCPHCNGTGKEFVKRYIEKTCPNCHGEGKVKLKCKYCDNGTFTTKSGRKVKCKACNGTGIWKEVYCNVCNPHSFRRMSWLDQMYFHLLFGSIREEIEVPQVCSWCGGKGKKEKVMFNPLIPKDAILALTGGNK